MIKLGDSVKDKITGYVGIAIGRSEFLYSSSRVEVQSDAMDGPKLLDPEWFDEARLTITQQNHCLGFQFEVK